MKRVLSVASVVVAVALALRPEPRAVVVKTTEHRVRLDSATQLATVPARLRNNTRDSTSLLGCLGTPAFDIDPVAGAHCAVADARAGRVPAPGGLAAPRLLAQPGPPRYQRAVRGALIDL